MTFSIEKVIFCWSTVEKIIYCIIFSILFVDFQVLANPCLIPICKHGKKHGSHSNEHRHGIIGHVINPYKHSGEKRIAPKKCGIIGNVVRTVGGIIGGIKHGIIGGHRGGSHSKEHGHGTGHVINNHKHSNESGHCDRKHGSHSKEHKHHHGSKSHERKHGGCGC